MHSCNLHYLNNSCVVKISDDINYKFCSLAVGSEHRLLHRRSVRKSANVGGNRVLECDVNYPGGEYVRHIITWRKQGLEAPIFILFDGYPPRMDTSYHGRIRLVGQASIEINNITTLDEGGYECTVLFLDKNDDTNINGTWIHLTVNSKFFSIVLIVFLKVMFSTFYCY